MSQTTKFLLWIYFVAVCAIGAGHTFISSDDPLFPNQPRLAHTYHPTASIRHRGPHVYASQAHISADRGAPLVTISPLQASNKNQNQKETQ
jgi:hypothetical protein